MNLSIFPITYHNSVTKKAFERKKKISKKKKKKDTETPEGIQTRGNILEGRCQFWNLVLPGNPQELFRVIYRFCSMCETGTNLSF